MPPKLPKVSQGTIDQKKKSRMIIDALFPQFEENETLQNTCLSRDSLIHMDKLCTEIQQRHSEQFPEDQWSHVINLINEALVKRINSKGTPGDLPESVYSLKSDDFRDAHHAGKLRDVNLASLFVMARELNLMENLDGIFVRRQATSPLGEAQPVQTADATSLRPASRRRAQRDNNTNPPLRPPASPVPSGPAAVSERQQKTEFNNPRYSDLSIVLRGRRVFLHRVILCTVSDRFDSLLEGSEPGVQLELMQEDPEAMMVLLQHMYNLPYERVVNENFRLLQHHASVFVLAGKYQYHTLEVEACDMMRSMINSHACSLEDFLQAIRVVFATASRDSIATACLVAACVADLRLLKQNAEFLLLLREFPDLGFEILRHQDLENVLPEAGEWEQE